MDYAAKLDQRRKCAELAQCAVSMAKAGRALVDIKPVITQLAAIDAQSARDVTQTVTRIVHQSLHPVVKRYKRAPRY